MKKSRNRILGAVVVAASLSAIGNADAALISSTFDTDGEGWVVSGDATSAVPDFVATGGNPDGHIEADDRATGGTWYFQAPVKFLGDLSGALGQLLSFDLRQTGSGSQFSNSDVILNGDGMALTLDFASNPPVDEWTSYAVRLDATEGWMKGAALATEADILAVLSSLDRLRIRGEFISGPDTGRLDNVSVNVVPVPAAVYCLGSGLVGIFALRKRVA